MGNESQFDIMFLAQPMVVYNFTKSKILLRRHSDSSLA